MRLIFFNNNVQQASKLLAAGASPKTPLGKLAMLPRPP